MSYVVMWQVPMWERVKCCSNIKLCSRFFNNYAKKYINFVQPWGFTIWPTLKEAWRSWTLSIHKKRKIYDRLKGMSVEGEILNCSLSNKVENWGKPKTKINNKIHWKLTTLWSKSTWNVHVQSALILSGVNFRKRLIKGFLTIVNYHFGV